MKFNLLTVILGIVGATCFNEGSHNVVAHPEAPWQLSWFMLATGVVFLGLVNAYIVAEYKRWLAAKRSTPHELKTDKP